MTITTIAQNDRRAGPYIATAAQTVFPYDFPIYDEGDLAVVRVRAAVATALVLNTDYTVTGVEDPAGGTIVLAVGSTAADEITIDGATQRVATTYFQDGGDFLAGDINRDRNRLVMMAQEQGTELDDVRAVAEAAASQEDLEDAITEITGTLATSAANAEASAAAAEISAAAAQDALEALLGGGGLADAPVSPAMQPVVVAATLANARAALGLGTAAVAATGDFMAAGTGALKASNLSDLANAATARANLGLGTLAVAGAGSGLEISAGAARLTDTAVAAGTYGDADNVLQITVDAKGRLTDVNEVPIGSQSTWSKISSSIGTSAVAAVDFALTGSYSRYLFNIRDMAPAADAVLAVRFSTNGGVSYVATASYDYNATVASSETDSLAAAGATSAILFGIDQKNTTKAFGWMELDLVEKTINAMISHGKTGSGDRVMSIATGICGAAGTITHVRFLYSTGNVARRSIQMSGLA